MRVLRSEFPRPLDLLAIGAGGRVAAASSASGVRGDVDVWDLATGGIWFTCGNQEREVSSLAFDPGQLDLLIGTATAVTSLGMSDASVIGLNIKRALDFPQVAVQPLGPGLVITDSTKGDGGLACYHRGGRNSVRPVWSVGPVRLIDYRSPAWAPDGTRVAAFTRDQTTDRVRHAVRVLDTGTGQELALVVPPGDAADPFDQLAFSADGAKLLARSSGRTVKVFDAATGQPAGELVHPGRPYVTGMAVHPSGTVACSRTDGTVWMWDLTRGELVRTLDWKLGRLVSVAFSPDGAVGAAGTEDGRVVVWDVD